MQKLYCARPLLTLAVFMLCSIGIVSAQNYSSSRPCDDGNPETLDIMDDCGNCFHIRGVVKVVCDDGDPKTTDFIDPKTGQCKSVACDDGDPTTKDIIDIHGECHHIKVCEPDCDNDGIPDYKEDDCDNDGIPDDCEDDCDNDGIPDDCEDDWNKNGVPDDCDPDCDNDGKPDDMEPDCDNDGIPDDCEDDCDKDGIPDDCEDDCDNDGVPDDCEDDWNKNGIPDDCEDDCDNDGIPDDQEDDYDGDGVPDDCDPCPGDKYDKCECPDLWSDGCKAKFKVKFEDCFKVTVCSSEEIDHVIIDFGPARYGSEDKKLSVDGFSKTIHTNKPILGVWVKAGCNSGTYGKYIPNPKADDCMEDCDKDGKPDWDEPDCDKDGIPDDCEDDCDNDGVPDDCEDDWNKNGIPDDCEEDCDNDGKPDSMEPDYDGDGIPDDCDRCPGDKWNDCDCPELWSDGCKAEIAVEFNGCHKVNICSSKEIDFIIIDFSPKGYGDEDKKITNVGFNKKIHSDKAILGVWVKSGCDSGSYGKYKANPKARECAPDCDNDGTPDYEEEDWNKNGIPDDCEADCDNDGKPDSMEPDSDGDGVPDDCDLCPYDKTDKCECPGLWIDGCKPDVAAGFENCRKVTVCSAKKIDYVIIDFIPKGYGNEDKKVNLNKFTKTFHTDESIMGVWIKSGCLEGYGKYIENPMAEACKEDCDDDGMPDSMEEDKNKNGIPDDCEPDCDNDGIPDYKEDDYDKDGIPDDCDPCPGDKWNDCDCPELWSDGCKAEVSAEFDGCHKVNICSSKEIDFIILDFSPKGYGDEDKKIRDLGFNKKIHSDKAILGVWIKSGCDGGDHGKYIKNPKRDDCEPDCDNDGTPDWKEDDCDKDGTPDDCEPDCDNDGVPDDCEEDWNKNGIPDDCEPDCDNDGKPDSMEPDYDKDGVPDDCDPCPGDKYDNCACPDLKSDGCKAEVAAVFDGCYDVTVCSSKDLSNIVLDYSPKGYGPEDKKLDNLSGFTKDIKTQKALLGVWVKSGCNSSGDCPGCGEYIPNPKADYCDNDGGDGDDGDGGDGDDDDGGDGDDGNDPCGDLKNDGCRPELHADFQTCKNVVVCSAMEITRVTIDYHPKGYGEEDEQVKFSGQNSVEIKTSKKFYGIWVRSGCHFGWDCLFCGTYIKNDKDCWPKASSAVGSADTRTSDISNNITVYPNPANEEVFLNLKQFIGQKAKISVFNSEGQFIFSQDLDEIQTSSLKLDMNGQAAGKYFVKVEFPDEQQSFSKPFIIVNR